MYFGITNSRKERVINRLGVVRFAFGVFQIFIIVQNLPNNESCQ